MQTLPKVYTPPKLITYTPESWQARLVTACEQIHRENKSGMVVVVLGNGPVRWWRARPDGVEGR